MKTRFEQSGTIDNTGDIQSDYLPLPGETFTDPGIAPPARGQTNTPSARGQTDTPPARGQTDTPPARGQITPLLTPDRAVPADPAAVAGDAVQSPVVAISSAGTVSGASGSSTGAASLALKSKSSIPVTYAPLVITPEFGASITSLIGTAADPTTAAEVEGAIDAAISYYDTDWTSSVPVGTVINGTTINTVNISIQFDYGMLDGQAMTADSGASDSRYGLITIGNGSYSTLYSTVSRVLPNLPASDPTDGSGTFLVTEAQSQLLGTSATGADPAGWVGLNSIKNGVTLDYSLANQAISGEVGAVGAIEHEMSEIFGRTSDLGMDEAKTYSLFDLYQFKAPNTPALTAGAADYFSLNNGTTALGYFNNHPANGGDAGDWASSGAYNVAGDAFDAFLSTGTGGTISNLDTMVLASIGLQQAPRTLQWTGAAGTSFSTAADWNDITRSLNPAQTPPGGIDTAQFLNAGGTISGTGTAAALQFGGSLQWDVASGATLSALSSVTVGQGGTGSLLVNGGINGFGTADAISGAAGTNGASVIVAGTGSAWRSSGQLTVGISGTGSLTISNGGSVGAVATASLPAMVLGASAGGNGMVTVTGIGSVAVPVGQIDVGQAGSGTLTIVNAGTVFSGSSSLAPAQGIDIAEYGGSVGNITVSGANSRLDNTGEFIVGDAGVGSFVVGAGGTIDTSPGAVAGLAGLVIANTSSASGSSVNVSGKSSELDVLGTLDVGSGGSGALQISGGATVTANALDAGTMAGSVGQIALSGLGTELSVSGPATVADAGTTVLSVLSGSTLAAASLTIGAQSNSSGAVVVSGNGSLLQLAGTLNVGTVLGTGELTVGRGGAVHAAVVNLQGQVVLQGGLLDPTVLRINPGVTVGGYGTIEAGDIIDEAVIQASANPAGEPEVLRGTVLGGGTLDCDGTITTNAAGVLQINSGGTLELTGPVLNATTTSFADDLTPTDHYSLQHSVVDVNFAGASGVLRLDDIADFAGTIATFYQGNEFVIAGGTLSGLSVSNGNTLTMFDRGSAAGLGGMDQFIFASAVTASGFDIVNGDTVQVECFAAGTLIETGDGPAPVENLAVGDAVQTLSGGIRRIVWVGSRSVDCTRHLRPETVWPVRIERGAFAENIPLRDLFISPDHAIYIDGVLIPARLLVNGSTIRQLQVDHIAYHHIELERHDVILAEGLAAETYLDVGNRHLYLGNPAVPNTESPARLWEMSGCAPLVLTGETLRTAQSALAERAWHLSRTTAVRSRHSDHAIAANGPYGNSFETETYRYRSVHMQDAVPTF